MMAVTASTRISALTLFSPLPPALVIKQADNVSIKQRSNSFSQWHSHYLGLLSAPGSETNR